MTGERRGLTGQADIQSRSLITGEVGHTTVEIKHGSGRDISPNDVMFTVNKLATSMSQKSEHAFSGNVGKIQATRGSKEARTSLKNNTCTIVMIPNSFFHRLRRDSVPFDVDSKTRKTLR